MLLAARQLGVLERPDRLGQVADRAGVQRTGVPLQVDELDRLARLAALYPRWQIGGLMVDKSPGELSRIRL
jgi:hypothetical protein